MRRTWGLLWGLAALAVVAGGVWWALGRSAWRPPTPVKPALPAIALASEGGGAQIRNALQKPLFWSSRTPPEVLSDAAPSAEPESELAQMRLMAVLESAGQRVALLQRPDQSVLKLDSASPEGDWGLQSFDGLVAVFVSRTGQRVERPLEGGGAASAAPKRGAPNSSAGSGSRDNRPNASAVPARPGAPVSRGGQSAPSAPASFGLHPPPRAAPSTQSSTGRTASAPTALPPPGARASAAAGT